MKYTPKTANPKSHTTAQFINILFTIQLTLININPGTEPGVRFSFLLDIYT